MQAVAIFPSSRYNKDPKVSRLSKHLYAVIGGSFLAAAVISLVVYFVISGSSSQCEKISSTSESDINFCGQKCEFDADACAFECPFGYQTKNNFGCPLSCDCSVQGIYQGDIKFEEESLPKLLMDYGELAEEDQLSVFSGGSVRQNSYLWGDDIIGGLYYLYYNESVSPELYKNENFVSAIKNMEERTCIRIRPMGNKKPSFCFRFTTDEVGCWSNIGKEIKVLAYTNQKCQQINWEEKYCLSTSTIQHEIMHSLGFNHEHTRSDRDNYVTINKDNISKKSLHNFKKLKADEAQSLGVAYDFRSVMHYWSKAFAIDYDYKTIIAKNDQGILRGDFMSEEDVEEINNLYPCPSKGGRVMKGSVTSQNRGNTRFDPPPTDPNLSHWTLWTEWSGCSCDGDRTQPARKRDRGCIDKGYMKCGPETGSFQFETCHDDVPCSQKENHWSFWGEWSECNHPCNTYGPIVKIRDCIGKGECKRDRYGYSMTGYCYGNCGTDKEEETTTTRPIYTTQPVYTTRAPIYTTRPVYTTKWPSYTTTKFPYYTTTWPATTRAPFYTTQQPIYTTRWSGFTTAQPYFTTSPIVFTTRTYPISSIPWYLTTAATTKYVPFLTTRWTPFATTRWTPFATTRWTPYATTRWTPYPTTRWTPYTTTRWTPYTTTKWTPFATTRWTPYATTKWTPFATTKWTPYPTTKWTPYATTQYTNRWTYPNTATMWTPPVFTTKYTRYFTNTPFQTTSRWVWSTVTSVMTRFTSNIPTTDFTISSQLSFSKNKVPSMQSVCTLTGWGFTTSYFGDFNGDLKTDVVCAKGEKLYIGNANYQGSINRISWQGGSPYCAIGNLNVIADFNGDGLDDMLCRKTWGSALSIILSQSGQFSSPAVHESYFCRPNKYNDVLMALDVNGDGKDDLLCRETSGKYYIKMNQT